MTSDRNARISDSQPRTPSKTRRHYWILLLIFSAVLIASIAVPVNAQSYLDSVGTPPFTTKIPVENGFINGANGNLHLEIPLASFSQRAGVADEVVLMYDSAIWTDAYGRWEPLNVGNNYPNRGGWRLVTSRDSGTISNGETDSGYCAAVDDYKIATLSPWIITGPDGTQHSFNVSTVEALYPDDCPYTGTPTASGYASDGSGFHISISNYTSVIVQAPDGTIVEGNGSPVAMKDANGNFTSSSFTGSYNGTYTFTYNYFDSVGRTIAIETYTCVYIDCSDYTPVTHSVTVLTAQAGTSTYTYTMQRILVDTYFQTGIDEFSSPIEVLQSIQLPDGTSYSFTSDSGTVAGHYGLLTSMTLPTGGQINYTYANFTDASGKVSRWITNRTTPDSSTGWNYTPLVNTSCGYGQVNCQQQMTITKPSGDNEVFTFTLNGGAWLTNEQTYNGSVSSANLLTTTTACYTFVTVTNGQCSYSLTTASPAFQVHKLAQTTTLPIPGSNVSTTTEYAWDSNNYGNLVTLSEWNFYTGTLPTTADRTTTLTYLNGSSYIAANILNRPATVTVTDKNGNTVAKTVNCYDYASGCGSYPLTSSFGSATNKTNHDDANYGTTNTVRGDLTQVQRLVSGTSSYLTKSMRYDMTGQLLQATDWSNLSANSTSYDYTDHYVNGTPSGPTNAFPTTITGALSAGSFTATYEYGTGQLASVTDANNQTTSFTYADSLSRLTYISLPNGGMTNFQYDNYYQDRAMETYIGITTTGCGNCWHDTRVFDGMGRAFLDILDSDPDGSTFLTDQNYDNNGRSYAQFNPYRSGSDPTYGYSSLYFDGLDRTYMIQRPDGNFAHTDYGAAITTTLGQTAQQCASSTYGYGYPTLQIDDVGNKRQTWTDGFGRLIETDEPDSTGSLNKKSCYTYDLNNNLTGVLGADGSQTRVFSYDLLSRLTSKKEPETETDSWYASGFYYTTSGGSLCSGDPSAICRRTDGRSITTTYTYDSMNRLTGKTYSDSTPAVTYSYDQASYNGLTITNGKGRRTGMSDGSGQTAWSYDSIGDPLAVSKKINGQTKTMSYTFNLDGSLATIVYPGGRTITYATSNAQRPTSAKDISNSINYALNATYAPQGALALVQNGSSLVSTLFYNNRLETCRISVKNTGTAPTSCADTNQGNVLDLAYGYGQSSYYGSGSSFNNGNIASIANNITAGRTQTYSYDPLNRLLTAQSSATSGADCWGQGFGSYSATLPTLPLADDALNNQLLVTNLKCSSSAPNWSVNGHNEITNSGFSYDYSGDNTADGGVNTFTFDAENRLTSVVTGGVTYCYSYDGNDLRVQKGHGTCSSPTVDKLYWRDTSGNTIAETDQNGSTTNSSYNEYVFFAGKRIAQSIPSSSTVYYYAADHLGSTRVVTSASGSPCYEADFLPYGTENTPSGFTNSCSTNYKFTGYERDPETNNDYAFARYYSPRLERFLSPDLLNGDVSDSQTLNKYSYARNNPTNLTDPSGLDPCEDDCGGGFDPCFIGCGGDPGNSGDPPDRRAGPQPPSYSPPTIGTDINPNNGASSGDPWAIGCEMFGMPCGMQFPSGGGGAGCTFGGGSCGGMANGYQDPGLVPVLVGGGGGCVLLEPCGASVGIGSLITMTALAIADMIHTVYESRKQTGPPPAHAPTPPQNPADSPGAGWEWRGPGPPGSGEGAWYNPGLDQSLRPNLTHPGPIGPHWDWKDSDGKTWRLKPL